MRRDDLDPGGPSEPDGPKLHVRTAWISDLHLGTPGWQAVKLLAFLRALEGDDPAARYSLFNGIVAGFAIAPTLINGNALVQQIVPQSQLTEALTWVGTSLGVGVSFGSWIAGSLIDVQGSPGGFRVVQGAAVLAVVATLVSLRRLRADSHRAEPRTVPTGT